MILDCQNISKAFGEHRLFAKASFNIKEKEKIALVGVNGAGKTTLLKIILGQVDADSGNISIAHGTKIGYLSQHQDYSSDGTVMDALSEAKNYIFEMEEKLRLLENQMKNASGTKLSNMMESYTQLTHDFELNNGYAAKSEIVGVLKGLGFTVADGEKPFSSLSGGQRTRIALGRLLLCDNDLILLDEPTNHLDTESITWLESFLSSYKGAVLVVSHDRFFLDRFVTRVIGIENLEVNSFSGNYTNYSNRMEQLRSDRMNAYINQRREIEHQEAVIAKLKQFNREKSIKRAESRQKLLDKTERLKRPDTKEHHMYLTLKPRFESGKDVLSIEGLSMRYGDNELFSDLNMDIKKGERIALIGNNGTGKTTILKLINGIISPVAGTIHLGSNVHTGYYDQEHQVLSMHKTMIDEISDDYPDMTVTQIRNTLASFLFTGDEVFQTIGSLSGGERGRLSLAKLMLSKANFLILDEPTNHLDIMSKEILESALRSYTGTVLYVSHDRYFINRTATRIIELNNKQLTVYLGDYDYYLTKKQEVINTKTTPEIETTDSKKSWQEQKEENARIRKRKNDLKKTEERIEALEARNAKIDTLLTDPAICTDPEKCTALSDEKNKLNEELSVLYDEWEILST